MLELNSVEYIHLMDDNKNDKSFIPSTFIEALFSGNSLREKRESYLVGKKVGFILGSNYFKPNKLIKSLGLSSNTKLEKDFFELLDVFFNRFSLCVAWHPNEGMIFQRIETDHSNDSERIFSILIDNEIKNLTKSELLQKFHLAIEKLSNEDLWRAFNIINKLEK